jgi:hypothetical protein
VVAVEAPHPIATPVEKVAPPALGKLTLEAVPYCMNGRVDGVLPIDKGRTVEIAPGTHRVRCEYEGRAIEREVAVEPGKTALARIDFLGGPVVVQLQLSRGDAVSVGDGKPVPRGGRIELKPKQYEFRLFKGGAMIAHAWLDVPVGGCVLRDDPLECVKP